MKPQEKIEYLTFNEVKELLDSIDNDYYYLLVRFLYETACRSGEAYMLRVKDFSYVYRTVDIVTLKQRDAHPVRSIRISEELSKMFKERIEDMDLGKKDFLFCKMKGEMPVSHQAFYNYFSKQILLLFGKDYQEKKNPHILRHSRAIHLLQGRYMDIALLSKLLGHASITNTMVYSPYYNTNINDDLEKAHKILKL